MIYLPTVQLIHFILPPLSVCGQNLQHRIVINPLKDHKHAHGFCYLIRQPRRRRQCAINVFHMGSLTQSCQSSQVFNWLCDGTHVSLSTLEDHLHLSLSLFNLILMFLTLFVLVSGGADGVQQ